MKIQIPMSRCATYIRHLSPDVDGSDPMSKGRAPDADDVGCRGLGVACGLRPRPPPCPGKKIDLRTKEGVAAVKGQWKYHDVKSSRSKARARDGKPNKTYNIEPRADGAPTSTTASGRSIAPETLKDPALDRPGLLLLVPDQGHDPARGRGEGRLLPDDRRRLRRGLGRRQAAHAVGKAGEAIVAGFNVPNRVELKDAKPGKVYQIAVFGINGPISAAPSNWIFLKDTYLDLVTRSSRALSRIGIAGRTGSYKNPTFSSAV